MNYKIKQLIESLFDDDTFSVDDDNIFNSPEAKNLLLPSVSNILIKIIGVDIPRGWKKDKDKDNVEIITCKRLRNALPNKYMKNVINLLENHGFIKYEASVCTYAFVHKMDYTDFLNRVYKNKGGYGQLLFRTEYRHIDEYNDWIQNVYPKMDPIALKLFSTDPSYKEIYISPDRGIILTIQNSIYTDFSFNTFSLSDNRAYCIATIKLTGEVLYNELSSSEASKSVKSYKDNAKRILFLSAHANQMNIKNYFTEFKLNDDGIPYGITYFNWSRNVCESTKSKKYNIPNFLLLLLDRYKFHLLNDIEKDDDGSIYQLTRDSLTIKFYKDIETPVKNMDSKMVLELDDYKLDQYKSIYNI